MDKVTIVIPTRDRADVLRYCLQAALSLTYPNLAILVSDNSSVDDTAEVVSGFRDERLTYVRTAKRVSMSSNWEFALSHVQEGWVTVIGDDDAVLPGGIERMLEIAAETGVSAIRSATCGYSWPSILKQNYGRINVPLRRGYRVYSTRDMLQSVLDGRRTYNKLPVLYNGGFVRTEVISAIREVSGKVFRSQVPDVYSAIAICSQMETYAYSFSPLAINGASAHSNGSATFSAQKGSGVEKDGPDKKYMSEVDFPFHPSVPLMNDGRFPAILQCVVYECFRQARDIFPLDGVSTSPREQLALILSEAAKSGRQDEFAPWVSNFCAANDISAEDAVSSKNWAKAQTLQRRRDQIMEAIDALVIDGTADRPIETVYEAAVAIGATQKAFGHRWSNWGRQIKKLIQRKVSRGAA